MTVPALITLLAFLYLRPHEIFEGLAQLPLIPPLMLLTVIGFAVDALGQRIDVRGSPPVWWAFVFLGWIAFNGVRPGTGGDPVAALAMVVMLLALYVVVALGLTSLERMSYVATAVVVINLVLAVVGAHQSIADTGCIGLPAPEGRISLGEGRPDGRPCADRPQCYDEQAEPDYEYLCVRVGLFGTSTIQGRSRYRGILQDPNELAFTLAASLPLLFLLVGRFGRFNRALLILFGLVVVLWAVVSTRSRSGQIANLAVLGVYFVRRYGWRGIAGAAVLAAPLLVLGGRGGERAAASTLDRYEAWRAGIELMQSHPLWGVGPRLYTEYHHLTAHNSFLLVGGELGFVGLFLFVAMFYVAIKTCRVAMRRTDDPLVAAWGTALLASFVGSLVSMMFLSLSYHLVLWVHIGLAGAFYGAARRRLPDFEVRLRGFDVALCGFLTIALVAAAWVLITLKGY